MLRQQSHRENKNTSRSLRHRTAAFTNTAASPLSVRMYYLRSHWRLDKCVEYFVSDFAFSSDCGSVLVWFLFFLLDEKPPRKRAWHGLYLPLVIIRVWHGTSQCFTAAVLSKHLQQWGGEFGGLHG